MPRTIPLVIHATHEAGHKIGGIGAVLAGLLGSRAYNEQVQRSILVGPMFGQDPLQMERMVHPSNGLTIHYSSLHGIFDGVEESLRARLQEVERTFQVGVLYGVRRFGEHAHEVVLVDATQPNPEPIHRFHYHVWEHYGIDSERYSGFHEYNLYFAIAQPLFAVLKALEVDQGLEPEDRLVIAHEWLGMPVVFAAQLNEPGRWRTVFYAHEVATARLLVEGHPGHDTRFYNALSKAREWHLSLEDLFGDQSAFFKHAIVQQAVRCDHILAVGDLVVEELRFLGPDFRHRRIDRVYNGLPVQEISLEEKLHSRRLLQQYARNLVGYRPDHIFTHVARMVLSKGLWRDIRVMEHLDGMLAHVGRTAVLFVLSTAVPGGRRPEWVHAWEAQYGWPVGHRADNGDLQGPEVDFFFNGVEPFNRRARNSRIVFVNQFGWEPERCGRRMPPEMTFLDLRRGSDVEFGQSIYEPFGIAQVEPLNFGAISCVSNVCGCVGFMEEAIQALRQDPAWHGRFQNPPNRVVADYVTVPATYPLHSPWDALAIDQGVRDWIEHRNSGQAAQQLFQRLPTDTQTLQERLETGEAMARRMSWEVVVREHLLPSLERARH